MLRFCHVLLAACLAVPVGLSLAADNDRPATDLHDDPLPTCVLARLGTVRLRHSGCLALSPDGKTIASGEGHTIRIWDRTTGKELGRFTVRFKGYLHGLHFSADGRKLAALADAGLETDVWDVVQGKRLFEALETHGGGRVMLTAQMAFTADGKTLHRANEAAIYGYDATTGEQTFQFRHNIKDVNSVAFSADGKLCATASTVNPLVQVWDVPGKKLVHVLKGHRDLGIWCVAFSRDGSLLATGGSDQTARLWDLKTGKELTKLEGHGDKVIAVAFTPDSKVLATACNANMWSGASGEQALRFWDLANTQKPLKTITAPDVGPIAFSADGKTLAWICCDQSVRLFDWPTRNDLLQDVAHHGAVSAIAFSPDGKLLASASSDRTVRLWDAGTGKHLRVLQGHTDRVHAVAFSPDGKWLASGSRDRTAALWEVTSGEMRFRTQSQGNDVRAVAFSPDGKLLATGGLNCFVFLWEVPTGKEVLKISEDEQGATALAFSLDGKVLATGFDTSAAVRLRDATTGKLLRTQMMEKPAVTSLAFSADGNTLAAGCDEKTILWEMLTGKERARFPGHLNRRGSVAFSPDGRWLASGTYNLPTMQVWELATGRELGPFQGHEHYVFGVAISPDGKKLATGSGDSTVLIWDLAALARDLPALEPKRLDQKELAALWTDLADGDAAKAYTAMRRLLVSSADGVPFLRRHVQPVPAPDARHLAGLISDLENGSFAAREKAGADLAKLGELAEPMLRRKLAAKPSLDTSRRLEALLQKLNNPLATRPLEEVRALRAVEVLEQAATPEAREVLKSLADGAEGARLTRAAQAALGRLAGR
jgi:WD40 repeat protein